MTTTAAPVRPAPVETVTPIKPSEAIRLGCLISPPAVGAWLTEDGSTCALGAMQLGFGDEPGGIPWSAPYTKFRDGLPMPVPGRRNVLNPGTAVMILNDLEGWSRERIADWLEAQGL